MGLLLSVLITCVGVLEVIACYTQFRVGSAYSECKSNLRDVAKYYAVELRKHELHFEPGPDDTGPSTSQDTLSELIRKRTVRTQHANGHVQQEIVVTSCSDSPEQGTPNLSLKVPRNSISGLDSPTVQKLMTPELDISEAVEKIQNLDSNEWTRKSPSPCPDKLEIVDKDFWKSRSPSPFPESDSGVELIKDIPIDDVWDKLPIFTQSSIDSTDLEVQDITEHMINSEALFGITAETAENEETRFDEAFLRSLDGVKSAKCDDRRRSFRKKRNSSSTSSKASSRSMTSLDEIEPVDKVETKKISPLTEEEIELIDTVCRDINGHQVFIEKCESIASPAPENEASVTKQEQTLFEAKIAPNITPESSEKGKANLNFTEKVKDLEISVQLLVTVKGTSQGDKMEYTTTVSQDQKPQQTALDTTNEVTKTTEEKSEFGNVKTSVTYGSSVDPSTSKVEPNLKDLQISSQSLIHAERTTVDDVVTSEAEFLKLFESFSELPDRQKDEFLKIIGHPAKPADVENIENLTEEPTKHVSNNTNPPEEKMSITDVTEMTKNTENTENVITPPEKLPTQVVQISSDNKSDNETQVISTKECEGGIEKQNQVEIIEITESNEITCDEKQIAQDTVNKTNDVTQEIDAILALPKPIDIFKDMNVKNNETITPAVKEEPKVINTDEEQHESTVANGEQQITIQTQQVKPSITEKTILESSKCEQELTNQTQVQPIQESSNQTQVQPSSDPVKNESSSESSSTPSTVIETQMRRASKTIFEEATPVQNQEMLKRRVSNSEISPKQANQAFWLIFSAEYTNAMEKDWHGQHFSCWQCDESLTGQRYVLRDDHPYCVKCYEQVFANPCEKCNRIIGIDSKDLSYKDKHWHEACFQCTTCSESLVDKQFGAKGEKIYCGNCYDKQFASRCDGCGKIFHAGTKKMEYKNRQWHEQCFKCCKCETPIGTKSFIPREKDIYCAGCYEEKFATRCVKCDKAIQSGGVTYKNEPWHRECFTCTHCNKNLAGQRFTSRDDKPCCAECFGRLFAKRCTSCSEPITGIGGTRFISFEDRHWHNDCFICASCTTSLVGRGFITDEDKIICPECAKERFM